jgi:ankyrin repeat protein
MFKSWDKFKRTVEKTAAGETHEAKAFIKGVNDLSDALNKEIHGQVDNAKVIGSMIKEGTEATQEELTQKNHQEAAKINATSVQASRAESNNIKVNALEDQLSNLSINVNNNNDAEVTTPKPIDDYFNSITNDNKDEKFQEFTKDGYNLTSTNTKGQTLLHIACEKNDDNLVDFVIEQRANPNSQDNQGITPLHLAAKNGNQYITTALIKNGANLDIQDNQGIAPIHLAAQAHSEEVVKILHEKGADLNKLDQASNTVAHYAYSKREEESGNAKFLVFLLKLNKNISLDHKNIDEHTFDQGIATGNLAEKPEEMGSNEIGSLADVTILQNSNDEVLPTGGTPTSLLWENE